MSRTLILSLQRPLKSLRIPMQEKKAVMKGKLTPLENKILVNEFGYDIGKGDIAKFRFIATLKHEDNAFDLAMCIQSLDFKLAAREMLHEKDSTLISMTTSESTWIERVEASFSLDQREYLEAYIQARLFKTFSAHYSHLLPAEKHQPQLSFCNADKQDCHKLYIYVSFEYRILTVHIFS